MSSIISEQRYLSLMQEILDSGVDRGDRTGTGTRSLFSRQLRFDLREGFPALTTKKLHMPSVIHELLWFLSGDTNVAYLQENGVRIWNEWADENGELGPVYGQQWRRWRSANGQEIDQIANLIEGIKTNPNSRRHIVSAWNVGQLAEMALPPCHLLFQFYVSGNELSCQLTQRSADYFLGVPFNIASYALLTHMVAAQCGLQAREFIWCGGDVHLYHNHFEQAQIQISRKPFEFPTLQLNDQIRSIDDYTAADITLVNYEHHPRIAAPISV